MPPVPQAAATKLPATTTVMRPETTGSTISSRSFFKTSQLGRSRQKARSTRSMDSPSRMCGDGIPAVRPRPGPFWSSRPAGSDLESLEQASPDRFVGEVPRRPGLDEALLAQDLRLEVLRQFLQLHLLGPVGPDRIELSLDDVPAVHPDRDALVRNAPGHERGLWVPDVEASGPKGIPQSIELGLRDGNVEQPL